jgi:hypothetical protein
VEASCIRHAGSFVVFGKGTIADRDDEIHHFRRSRRRDKISWPVGIKDEWPARRVNGSWQKRRAGNRSIRKRFAIGV